MQGWERRPFDSRVATTAEFVEIRHSQCDAYMMPAGNESVRSHRNVERPVGSSAKEKAFCLDRRSRRRVRLRAETSKASSPAGRLLLRAAPRPRDYER